MPKIKLRPDHIIVIIAVTGIMVLGILFLDTFLAYRSLEEFNRFESEFEFIQSEYEQRHYQQVIALSESVISKADSGPNDVRAKCYIGLSYIKLGRDADVDRVIGQLVDQYWWLRYYKEQIPIYQYAGKTSLIFDEILKWNLPEYKEMKTKPASLSSLLTGFDLTDFGSLIFVWTTSIIAYERVRNRRKSAGEPSSQS
jgi:hypothetical protein